MVRAGVGIFSWEAPERRSDRYGSFFLCDKSYNKEGTTMYKLFNDLKSFQGKRIKVVCKVVETRESGHIGDMFLGITPTTPEMHEIINLTVGTLVLEHVDFDPKLTRILIVPTDKRKTFWIDPNKLYRLHDQTVEVYFALTDDETPKVDIGRKEEDGTIVVERDENKATFQSKNDDRTSIPQKIESLGDGAFIISCDYKVGDKIEK